MTILNSILDVFTAVGEWISESVTALMPMFYDATEGLTFMGVLAVSGLAFSVIFLNLIGRFFSDKEYESALTAGKSL